MNCPKCRAAMETVDFGTNITVNLKFTELAEHFPFIGVAVWVAILLSVAVRRPDWEVLPETFQGTIFLLSLVTCASMMPVEKLPTASWQTTLGLGFVSSVFDNIPLTEPAPKQLMIQPTWSKLKPMSFVRYKDMNGTTMVPARFTKVMKVSNQIPRLKPANDDL